MSPVTAENGYFRPKNPYGQNFGYSRISAFWDYGVSAKNIFRSHTHKMHHCQIDDRWIRSSIRPWSGWRIFRPTSRARRSTGGGCTSASCTSPRWIPWGRSQTAECRLVDILDKLNRVAKLNFTPEIEVFYTLTQIIYHFCIGTRWSQVSGNQQIIGSHAKWPSVIGHRWSRGPTRTNAKVLNNLSYCLRDLFLSLARHLSSII